MEKRENFFVRLWNSLAFRLLWVVVSTFLPLNLIAVLMMGTMIYSSSRQMQQSLQWGLMTSMERFERGIGEIETEMDSFITSYLTDLTLAEGSDNMVSYEMISALKEIFDSTGLTGMFFLYDRMEDRLFVKYDNTVYKLSEAEQMKEQLSKEISRENEAGWKIATLSEQFFVKRDYEYSNYRIGFLVDIGKSLGTVIEDDLMQENRFYFTDGSTLLVWKSGNMYEETQSSWEDIFRKRKNFQDVVWEDSSRGLGVGMQIHGGSFWSAVPAFFWILMILLLFCMLLICTLWKTLQKRVIHPLEVLRDAMQQLEQGDREFRIGEPTKGETKEFIYIYEAFNRMAEEIRLSYEKNIKMLQAQLDNLRLQVNPHMLLNSFNMIYSLAETENYICIQEFSLYLVEYFRYVLKENDTFVALSKEMKFVESYINIQKIRFPDAFTSVYNMCEGTEEALVPPLLVQNFVENAMKYALIPGQTIEVLINVRRERDRLLISVCDTGRGIREDVLDHLQKGEIYQDRMGQKHIGIWNCRRRMKAFYDDTATMKIVSSPEKGTQVWLDLPWLTAGEQG